MSDSTSSTRGPAIRRRVMFVVLLLIIVALVVYYQFVRPHQERRLKLALVTWTQDPFWKPLLRGAQDCAKNMNVDLTIVQARPSVDEQTEDIQNLINSGIDGIAISPNDAVAQKGILSQAASKIPMVTFDTDAPDSGRKRFVGIDNYAAGRICASEMEDALPEGGPILISVGSVTMQHGSQRRQGVIDALLARGFDRSRTPDPVDAVLKGKKYSVVYTATDGGNPDQAVEAIERGLKAHPEVKGIIGLFSYSAPAALEAMKRLGIREGSIKVVGFDASDETQAALESGAISSSILQDSYRAGYETIEVLADEARGVPHGPAELTPLLFVGIDVLTKDNLQLLRSTGAVDAPAGAPSTSP